MRQGDFEETILITNDFGKDKFTAETDVSLVVVDFSAPVHALQDTLLRELRPKIKGTQVALNMISGGGPEHMALLSALLNIGVGIRLVMGGEDAFEEL